MREFNLDPVTGSLYIHRHEEISRLTTLMEAYEEKHYKVDFPEHVDVLYYWMESRGAKGLLMS